MVLYLALITQQPGVFVSSAFVWASDPYALNDPPGACTAYSASKPFAVKSTTGSIGPAAAFQALAIGGIDGAAGKITTLTILLSTQRPEPVDPESVAPQSAAKTYLA